MKALVVSGPEEFGWVDIPPPEPKANEALCRIEVCGICNSTDRELIALTQPYKPNVPFVLGHESVGTVVEVGAEVTRYRVGDQVTRVAAIFPGEERDGLYSGWGGFAEYGIVRDDPSNYTSMRQVVLPGELEPERAFLSISLAETRAWLEQVTEMHGDVAGRPVVVLGTGVAGLTATYWAKARGAVPLITLGRRPERLALARRCGADLALRSDDPELGARVRDATSGRMAAVLIEAIGKPAALPAFYPLLAASGVLAVYGAAPAAEYEAAWAQLPEGVRHCRPGPEEHRYTRRVAEEMLRGEIDTSLWLSHVWEADEIEAAFEQVAAGEVVKGCVRMR